MIIIIKVAKNCIKGEIAIRYKFIINSVNCKLKQIVNALFLIIKSKEKIKD